MKNLLKKIAHGSLEPLVFHLYNAFIYFEYTLLNIEWYIEGYRKPSQEERDLVTSQVTFIYKSFERQKMAKKLYKNIQSYYPGAKVIIADDSSRPLSIQDKNCEVIQLPFNSGLSYGLNRALEKVTTPYVMRMDDDELLTPLSHIGDELKFLIENPIVDLVGFGVMSTPKCIHPIRCSSVYFNETMEYAPLPLKIPHFTYIDKNHVVVGKPPNLFLTKTKTLKEIGWDDHIRMTDHKEFFIRCAGRIVSVYNPLTIIFHRHNQFDSHYQKYRSDIENDRKYIQKKYSKH